MPQLVITAAGRLRLIRALLQMPSAPTMELTVILFNNDVTPTRATVFADLVEATTSEGPQELDPADWQSPTTISNNASSTYGTVPLTFTGTTGTQTIYGMAVYDAADDTLIWAQRADTPFSLVVTQEVKVVPVFVFGSIYDPTP